MTIVNFEPFTALAGGALIGLSAALLYHFQGRIAGISGIFGGIIAPEPGDTKWRMVFILGLILGGVIFQLLGGETDHIKPVVDNSMIIIAGLLVGVGTTLGSGCTSGHGICGISRFSIRSIAATMAFMATGFGAVFVVRTLLGMS